MNQPDDQNNDGLRVSGYGPRHRQTLIVGIILAVIVAAIAAAAIWSNSREPEVGVQPTPRPTQAPRPTSTTASDTPTAEPTQLAGAMVADTATPEPTEVPATDTPTSSAETSDDNPIPTAIPSTAAVETPVVEIAPTPETIDTPTAEPTDTPVPPTEEPTAVPTDTPLPEPTDTPTIEPTPQPKATPTMTPTPVPMVPTILEIKARGNLIDQGIDQSNIKILSQVEHTWPDLTLGCGPIEVDNPARTINGWIVTLGNEEKVYTFHVASKEQGDPDEHLKEDIIANCTDVENRVQPTINVAHELRLHEARRAVLYRGRAGSEEKAIADIKDGALIQKILDALNTPIPIGNASTCETSFRLDFYVLRGVETVRFFCQDDWYRVSGDQEIWGCTQGAIPKSLLESVSPFFAFDPIPALPTFAPDNDISSNSDDETFEGLPCQQETVN